MLSAHRERGNNGVLDIMLTGRSCGSTGRLSLPCEPGCALVRRLEAREQCDTEWSCRQPLGPSSAKESPVADVERQIVELRGRRRTSSFALDAQQRHIAATTPLGLHRPGGDIDIRYFLSRCFPRARSRLHASGGTGWLNCNAGLEREYIGTLVGMPPTFVEAESAAFASGDLAGQCAEWLIPFRFLRSIISGAGNI